MVKIHNFYGQNICSVGHLLSSMSYSRMIVIKNVCPCHVACCGKISTVSSFRDSEKKGFKGFMSYSKPYLSYLAFESGNPIYLFHSLECIQRSPKDEKL